MAPLQVEASNQQTQDETKLDIAENGSDLQTKELDIKINYSQRAQWLRDVVLGANDVLISTACLMMGVGAVKQDVKSMIITGFAGLVAGACCMAIGEVVSVYFQYDMKRQHKASDDVKEKLDESEKEDSPSPFIAAGASALAFVVGAAVLLSASFIENYEVRLGVIVALSSLALTVFGVLAAVLGKAPVKKSCLRVLIAGWLAMAITFGSIKVIELAGAL